MKTLRFVALGCSLALFSSFAQAEDVPAPNSEPETALITETPPVPYNPAVEKAKRWYRDAGEYLASRSVRPLVPTDVNTKIITDAKRFDVSVGKRIPIHMWADEDLYKTWAFGVDGGMLASLTRYSSEGRLTFATNTFDGMFGAWVGFTNAEGWLVMFRAAHLSAHLVDNSPLFLTPRGYSQFWNEVIVGKTFPRIDQPSEWNLHVQGSVGLNNTGTPSISQPRANLGFDFGHAFSGPDTLGFIASADASRAGVKEQKNTYGFFLGVGYLPRPETTHRPLKIGVAHFTGSDYRNQLYFNTQNWTTFEIETEF